MVPIEEGIVRAEVVSCLFWEFEDVARDPSNAPRVDDSRKLAFPKRPAAASEVPHALQTPIGGAYVVY